MNRLAKSAKRLWLKWDSFFFAPQDLLAASAFRLVLGVIGFLMYAIRMRDWRFYFTDVGYISSSDPLAVLPSFYRPLIHWYPTTDAMALAMNIALVLAFLCLALGVRGRVAAVVAFVAHTGLIQRNYTIQYGVDFVMTFLLFSLIFIDSSRELSIMNLWRKSKPPRPESGSTSQIFSSLGIRLLQIQMCLIYGYTGLEKLKGTSWWDGTAVWAVIGNQQLMMFDTSFLKSFPLIVAAMTFGTVLFEVYFPVLVWPKSIRKWLLLVGIGLHLGIAAICGLWFFSFTMMSTYFVFLERDQVQAALQSLQRRGFRRTQPT